MGCCIDSSVAPEEDEEDMDGPLEDRSCTDVIFFVLFGAFMVGMFILFGMGLSKGNPHRLLSGTDVVGNVCGEKNEAIDNVTKSGLNMESKKYLYFDWVRTAKILGQESLTKYLTDNDIVGNFTSQLGDLGDFNKESMVARDYCISDAYANTAKLEKDSSPVYNLMDEEFQYYDDRSLSLNVKGVVLSKQKLKDNSEIVSLMQKDGTVEIYRTSKVTGSEAATSLLSTNPVSSLISSSEKICRYCVETCPTNFEPLLNKCVPSEVNQGLSSAASIISGSGIQDIAKEIGHDFQLAQTELGLMGLTALSLSILMTIAFRFAAGLIVYIIIALVVVVCIGGTIALWVIWWLKRGDLAEQQAVLDSVGQAVNGTQLSAAQSVTQSIVGGISSAKSQEEVTAWLVGAIAASIFTAIVLIVLLVLRKRIALVVTLFHEAGKAVHAMPYLVFVPLLTFLSHAVTAAVWVYALVHIIASQVPAVDPDTTYVSFQSDQLMSWLTWYHILGGFWIIEFAVACQHLVIAGSIAGWYFAKDKSSVGIQTVVSAFWRLIRYHLGTAAFGSLIIAVIRLLRLIVRLMKQIVERYEKKGGVATKAIAVVMKAVICCMQWCLACFQKFMEYINVNAYIETAIYGYSFCRAAIKAFQLLAANMLRVAAINTIGNFVLFLGKVIVVVATGVISYYIMKDNRDVDLFWPQIAASVLFAYLIADSFIGVYEMAIDTIFLCFCEDSSRNDGVNKPYYMSRDLMQFVENSKKALDALDHRQDFKQNEDKHQMMVRERKYSDGSIAVIDVD